ncbi:MAG: amidohydrolase family protein, partial [Planctomycetaceae bacterium]
EALGRVLTGKLRVMFCAHRADDLHTALILVREFKLRGTLALGTEGYLIRDSLREAGLSIVVHPTMQRVGGPETYHSFLGNAAALKNAGIRIAIGSAVEGYVPKTRVIRHEAAIAMVHGLGFQAALRSITLDAARILEIDKTHGSIEVGKQADLVLYDGDPFEHATHVTYVVVAGKLVHNRATRPPVPLAQRLFYHTPSRPCCIGW